MRYLTIALAGLALSITTACSSSKPTVSVNNSQSQFAQSRYVFTPSSSTIQRTTRTDFSRDNVRLDRLKGDQQQVREFSTPSQRSHITPTISRDWKLAYVTPVKGQRPVWAAPVHQARFARTRVPFDAQSADAQQLYQLFRGKLSDDQLVLLVQPLTYREDLPKVVRDAAYATMIDYYQRTDQPWKAMQLGEQMMQAYVNE